MSFSGFGDTSATFSLSRSAGSLVFVSVLSFVPWIQRLGLLMGPQNSSTWWSCLFIYIFLIDAWIFILSTSSSVPEVLAAAAAAFHCVFSKISSEYWLPYWIFSAFIFHPYFWFSHLFYWFFLWFTDFLLYVADFPPQTLTESIYLLISSFKSLIIFPEKFWNLYLAFHLFQYHKFSSWGLVSFGGVMLFCFFHVSCISVLWFAHHVFQIIL